MPRDRYRPHRSRSLPSSSVYIFVQTEATEQPLAAYPPTHIEDSGDVDEDYFPLFHALQCVHNSLFFPGAYLWFSCPCTSLFSSTDST